MRLLLLYDHDPIAGARHDHSEPNPAVHRPTDCSRAMNVATSLDSGRPSLLFASWHYAPNQSVRYRMDIMANPQASLMASDNQRKTLEDPPATSADREHIHAGEKWHRVVDCGRDVLQYQCILPRHTCPRSTSLQTPELSLAPAKDLLQVTVNIVFRGLCAADRLGTARGHIQPPPHARLAPTPTNDYWLLFFRCFQAIGYANASTVLEQALVSDISTQSGVHFGVNPIRPKLDPAIGPVIGGSRPPPTPFQNPLHLFLQPAVDLILFITVVVISSLFHVRYPQLNQTELGLCFLSLGMGMAVGSVIAGSILDWAKRRLLTVHGDGDAKPSTNDFPTEKGTDGVLSAGRVSQVHWCCSSFGSGLGRNHERATNAQALMLDLVPKQGSSITACNNLIRRALGAALVSAIQPMLDALGAGWAYILLGGLCLVLSPSGVAACAGWAQLRHQRRVR
ncbi:MFS general substrate transporter [Mycena amicta]|nr:MFS general substrate transporter [Mycena amicta]